MKKTFKFWQSLLDALNIHSEAYYTIDSNGLITIYYDQRKGKYVLKIEQETRNG
jgi:hypothetical protein